MYEIKNLAQYTLLYFGNALEGMVGDGGGRVQPKTNYLTGYQVDQVYNNLFYNSSYN